MRKDWNSCLFKWVEGATSGRLIVREREETFKPEDSTGTRTKNKQKLLRKLETCRAPSCWWALF